MERAVEWYHERLLRAPDAGPARDYLRSRGYDGEVVRQFRLGWAPDDWDALAKALEAAREGALRTRASASSTGAAGARTSSGAASSSPSATPRAGPSPSAGGSCRPGPGRRRPSGPSPSTRTPRSRRSTPSAGRSTRSTGPSRASSRRARSWCARATPTSSGSSRPACRGPWPPAAPRWPRSTSRCCATSPSGSCSPTTPTPRGRARPPAVYEWERKHEVDVAVADLPGGSDPGDLARTDPEALAACHRGGPAVPPVPGGPHAGGRRPDDGRGPGPGGRGRARRRWPSTPTTWCATST